MPFQVYTEVELSYMSREDLETYTKKLATLHKTMVYNLNHPDAKFWKRMEDLKKSREVEEKVQKRVKKKKIVLVEDEEED